MQAILWQLTMRKNINIPLPTTIGTETSVMVTLISSNVSIMTLVLLNNDNTLYASVETLSSETVKFTNVSFNSVYVPKT